MELIENYNNALQEIYDHVGFVENWVIAPIDDNTNRYWGVDEDTVYYADSIEEFESEHGNYYEDEIYKQRFYDKWIYEGEDFTMIFCNPIVDGMKWFRIFDNTKKLNK